MARVSRKGERCNEIADRNIGDGLPVHAVVAQPMPEANRVELHVIECADIGAPDERSQAACSILPLRIEAQRVRQLLRGCIELPEALEHDRQMKPMAGVGAVGFHRPREALLGRVEIAGIDGGRPALGPGTTSSYPARFAPAMSKAAAPVVHCLRSHGLGLILVSPTRQLLVLARAD